MQGHNHITVTAHRLPRAIRLREVLGVTVTIQAASQTRVMLIAQEGEATDQNMSEALFVS
jgi:hypothetical protein